MEKSEDNVTNKSTQREQLVSCRVHLLHINTILTPVQFLFQLAFVEYGSRVEVPQIHFGPGMLIYICEMYTSVMATFVGRTTRRSWSTGVVT